jgi:CO/xanthine dehydrogenase Mo-binding subunit
VVAVSFVLTTEDCPDTRFGLDVPDTLILARDKVRYVGEEVAAVAADTPEQAQEAVERIRIRYDPLPEVFDPVDAVKEEAVLVHEDKPGNVAKSYDILRGDLEGDLASCDHVFEEVFNTSRVLPCYMEPFGVIAQWEPDGRLTVYTGVQAIFQARAELAKALGMEASEINVKLPTVGGAFGGKIWIRNFHPITALLAKKARRPVKYVMTREEEFIASRPRVPARIKIKLGMMKDGTLVCKAMDFLNDNGAYSWAGPKVTLNMSMRTDCLYRFSSSQNRAKLVYTNKTPTSGFRGYGNAQAHFALESMIDQCSRKLGLDPVAVRLKNAVRQGDLTLHGWKLKSCGLTDCIEKAWAAINKDRLSMTDRNGRNRRGIGLACMTHVSGNRSGDNFDGSTSMMRFQEDGRLSLYHGESDMGQGASTVLAQIAAETLGIPVESVMVMPLSTDTSPFCFGSYSSRVTTVAGKSAQLAALQVREQILGLAGEVLEISPEDLEIENGWIHPRGSKKTGMEVSEVCRLAIRTKKTVPLTAYVAYDPPTQGADQNFYGDYSSAYSYAAQAVELEVDTETGRIRLVRVVCAHDVGFAINVAGVEGQILGGVSQGGGWGLYEDIVYEKGTLRTTGLGDYKIMTSCDMPKVEIILVETHDPVGPYGAKGVGEPTLIPMAPAIANAVQDAVGVRIRDLPLTAEKVFLALNDKSS